jgi:hypothetical protein
MSNLGGCARGIGLDETLLPFLRLTAKFLSLDGKLGVFLGGVLNFGVISISLLILILFISFILINNYLYKYALT